MKELIQEMVLLLKEARIKKGLSQRDLSAKIKTPQSHISKIEQGLIDLQVSSFIQMARSLELEVMLIPRPLINAVQGILRAPTGSKQIPAYRLSDEEDEFDD